MDILLVAINSKYAHTNLATRCLRFYSKHDVPIYESNINTDSRKVLADILQYSFDVIGFSCYIFNIEYVKKLISDIRAVRPNAKILVGGPEPCDGDIVLSGEGENAFLEILTGEKKQGFIDLDDLYGMYDKTYLDYVGNRPLYYEASRGCPFSCVYCMSGLSEGLRFKSLEVVKKELDFFTESGVSQVKFIDRTFNANKKFCKDILLHLLKNHKKTTFHFEMAADLFDDEMLEIVSRFPKGVLDFEVGIQSFNSEVLIEANRKSDLNLCKKNLQALRDFDNVHLHLDLIAGLYKEDLASFIEGFNQCIALRPHMLQVGFLKVLHGSQMEKIARATKYAYSAYPPYEVLSSPSISLHELGRIKNVEEGVSKYYNSEGFSTTLLYLMRCEENAFLFYERLGAVIAKSGEVSHIKKYAILQEMFGGEVADLLRFDYLKGRREQGFCPSLYVSFDDVIKVLNRDKNTASVRLGIHPESFEKKNVLVTFYRRENSYTIKEC